MWRICSRRWPHSYAFHLSKPRKFKTQVTVIYGETGVGKSRWASETYPDAYWKPPNSKWWDNYENEETIIIDEFYGWLPYCEMLRLLDRYPCQVETKGGSVNFAPKTIIILSNKAPEDWYDKEKCAWAPLERRIESYGQMMPGGEIMWRGRRRDCLARRASLAQRVRRAESFCDRAGKYGLWCVLRARRLRWW